MAEKEKFETNLLRFIAAELYSGLAMTASREMYQKSYFSLGVGEKTAVDQAVFAMVSANYQGVTPDLLNPQIQNAAVGFQPAPVAPSS